jgi:AcrR family transcriptional regulator
MQTLREEGFAGTSARAIARRGEFNQALIFYHFGSVLDLLVAVLETMSQERLAQYRAAIAEIPDLRTALSTARGRYATDRREGYITVLVELIGGVSSAPTLGPEIVRCMEPWIGFAQESIERFLGGTPLAAAVPTHEAARALLAVILGMELLDHLDPEADAATPLFRVAERLLQALEPLLGLGSRPAARSRRPQPLMIESGPDASVSRRMAEGQAASRSKR